MDQLLLILDVLDTAFSLLLEYWWVYTPFILWFVLIATYQDFTRTKYIKSLRWVLLELNPPQEVRRSLKATEIFFAGLHAAYKGNPGWKETFFGGKIPDTFSLEIVSNAGEVRFYARTLEGNRNLLESHLFAQYPDAEIRQVQDYVEVLPADLPNDDYDVFGTELMYTKENAYPIKTYSDFEDKGGEGEFPIKHIDPLAPLAEILGLLNPGEHLWLQLVIKPTGDEWVKKEGQPVLDKLQGKAPKVEPTFGQKMIDSIEKLLGLATEAPKEEKKENPQLSGTQRLAVDKIENKFTRLVFEGGYRLVYAARKDVFNRARIPAVLGMFKQVYSGHLNSFKPNGEASTSGKGFLHQIFPSDKGFGAAKEEFEKKQKIYKSYRGRAPVKKGNILSTEELATLFHLPGSNVQAPAIPRVDAKKGQPPGALPIR